MPTKEIKRWYALAKKYQDKMATKEIRRWYDLARKYQEEFKSWCEDIDVDYPDEIITVYYNKNSVFTVSGDFFRDFKGWQIRFAVFHHAIAF